MASAGDDRNGLLQMTVQTDGPPFEPLTLHDAPLYLFDENDKLKESRSSSSARNAEADRGARSAELLRPPGEIQSTTGDSRAGRQ
jgi:hypothetical protein